MLAAPAIALLALRNSRKRRSNDSGTNTNGVTSESTLPATARRSRKRESARWPSVRS